ncbi:EST/SMG-like protein 1 [Echria macrotheca]|uniref:EST/SMG-like protein 1 n=1 Tax=Echria macrotheca TaxID=438768 RepID=A0AAJ0F6I3_9PEZI|nr:EST/SMG-like protein 1 [Echria macrotheca]
MATHEDNTKTPGSQTPMDVSKSWSNYLRQTSKSSPRPFQCPQCRVELPGTSDFAAATVFRKHISTAHPELESTAPQLFKTAKAEAERRGDHPELRKSRTDARNSPTPRKEKDAESNSSSLKRENSDDDSQSPKRSRAQVPRQPPDTEFSRGSRTGSGHLWSENQAVPPPKNLDPSNVASNIRLPLSATHPRSGRQPRPPASASRPSSTDDGNAGVGVFKQPETRPISQEQLVAEVKGIYAGLVMVENKCIEVDGAQNAQGDGANTKLNNEQWQALIALHRTLLHEHHDFFLASQHPSASPALRRLASKYAMPARMWRHGIHSFLELLRHRLPASLEHMLTFIYLAYAMMALLYETVPAFEDTWIECLGDLGRYRMAIEDDNIRDREVWTAVSRGWYSKASDKAPTVGRLYHHQAILARPNAFQQLFYYGKSLTVAIPFVSAKDSIQTLFEPIMANQRAASVEQLFVLINAILFTGKMLERFESVVHEFTSTLDIHIGRSTRRFQEQGYHIGITVCYTLVGYGSEANPVHKAFQQAKGSDDSAGPTEAMAGVNTLDATPASQENAVNFAMATHDIVFRRFGDPNILTYVHTTLVFMLYVLSFPEIKYLARRFPWKLTALLLNTLMSSENEYIFENQPFPRSSKEEAPRPLPEDYALRGLPWAEKYFPSDWFSNDKIEDEEKGLEAASMGQERKLRILALGYQISQGGTYLRYDKDTHRFGTAPDFDIEMDPIPVVAPVESIDLGDLPDAVATP